jgi:multiple sugar transport system ATP-binding protein
VVEHLGPETFVYVDVGGRQLCCRTGRDAPARLGSQLSFAVEPRNLHLFDADSGLRL